MVFTTFSNKLANYVFLGERSVALPTEYYLGLSTTTPNADGTNITEPASDTGYSRKKMTALTDPSNGTVSNSEAIEYGEATGEYGTITHAVFFDVSGNPCFASALALPVEINSGDVFRIKAGNASFGFGDA